MDYLFLAMFIVFLSTTFTGIFVAWDTCDKYTGRQEANLRRLRSAMEAIEESIGLETLQYRLCQWSQDVKLNEFFRAQMISLLDWTKALQRKLESAPTAQDYNAFYVTSGSNAETATLGNPATMVATVEAGTKNQISPLSRDGASRKDQLVPWLVDLKRETQKLNPVHWTLLQRKAAPIRYPGYWGLFRPELLRFLDSVGRGSTFGLLLSTAISLAVVALGCDIPFTAVSTSVIGFSASVAGVIHGSSVYVQSATPHPPGNDFDAWFAARPGLTYWLILSVVVILVALPAVIWWIT